MTYNVQHRFAHFYQFFCLWSVNFHDRRNLSETGDSLYQMARSAYLLDDPKNNVANIEDQFMHTQFFALVDRQGKVRGQVYDGLKQPDLDRLRKDIRRVLDEKQISK